jgi:molybdenum cofactor biosynthesis protein B
MVSPTTTEHKEKASHRGPINVAVVTVSDTRTRETDKSGNYLCQQIKATGHLLHSAIILADEAAEIETALDTLAASEAQVVLFNGGTGISSRDTTFDVLSRKLEKTLPGFGEIFRMLSYEEIGASAIMSRATAGLHNGTVFISMPGSPAAVRLAWERLLSSELEHLAWEATR